MAQNKPLLEDLLSSGTGKSILFLGREGIFTKDEISRFLKKHSLVMSKELNESVIAVVEHHQLNPVEDDISNMAYDSQIPLYKLSDFEKLLSKSINADELLMGIKLSNDQDRIFRLLGNQNINEELFLKLLMMYEWHNDEDDNRNDRDTIMFTLRRYINIKPNEEDLLYSYLTLRRLATEATNPKLLLALIGFPNFEFLVRGKEKISLRESIARNTNIDNETIKKLLSFREMKINASLCANSATPLETLKTFANSNEPTILLYLASNKNIDDDIFYILLEKDEDVVHELLHVQNIDMTRLKAIENREFNKSLFAVLGANRYLSKDVLSYLLQQNNNTLISYLSANEQLNKETLKYIFDKNIEESYTYLATNPNLDVNLLESLYENHKNKKEILISLALNPSTPEQILRELFEKEDINIYKSLATNASLPLELLEHLKIDTRLQNELAQNPVFIKEYEQTLNYDKNAVQF
jgi:hypothetical protein